MTKPRRFGGYNLPRSFMIWLLKKNTLPETNIAPENRHSQEEINLPTIHFQGRLLLVLGSAQGFMQMTWILVHIQMYHVPTCSLNRWKSPRQNIRNDGEKTHLEMTKNWYIHHINDGVKMHMGVSKNKGTPKWMVKIMENPIKIGWFGGGHPYSWKHPYISICFFYGTSRLLVGCKTCYC